MKFTYTGIRVRNLERSIEFYKEIMKMRIIQKGKMEAGGIYVQLKSERSPQVLELNYYPPGAKFYEEYVAGSELDHLAFWCKDVRKEYRRLVDSGATQQLSLGMKMAIRLRLSKTQTAYGLNL